MMVRCQVCKPPLDFDQTRHDDIMRSDRTHRAHRLIGMVCHLAVVGRRGARRSGLFVSVVSAAGSVYLEIVGRVL